MKRKKKKRRKRKKWKRRKQHYVTRCVSITNLTLDWQVGNRQIWSNRVTSIHSELMFLCFDTVKSVWVTWSDFSCRCDAKTRAGKELLQLSLICFIGINCDIFSWNVLFMLYVFYISQLHASSKSLRPK